MKIAVNTRLLLPGRMDGIARFTYETLYLITKQHPEHQFYFFFDRPYHEQFIFSSNITPIVISTQARHPFLFYAWFEFSVTKQLNRIKPDLFLSPDGFLSLATNIKSLAVIHDLNFIHNKKNTPWLVSSYYNFFFPKFAKKATRIATVSEFSANDIALNLTIAKTKIDVVYNGVSEIFKPLCNNNEKELIKANTTGNCPYFVSISSIHPRKNIIGMLKAFEQFKQQTNTNHKLVLVGEKYFWTKEMRKTLKSMVFKQDVIFAGRKTDVELSKIIAAAEALLYVPFFEGFGLPLLEAFKSEVPVICSNTSSLPEVYGNAAIAVNPHSNSEILQAMLTVVNNQELKKQLIEKGKVQVQHFTWQKTADLLWNSILKSVNT